MSPKERSFEYCLLDVFTTKRLAGNPLAVLPSAAGLSDSEMQAIAAEFNLSETVFLLPPLPESQAAARARIFTPRRELDFAGHPTIGAAAVLDRIARQGDYFSIDENVGRIEIQRDVDDQGNALYWLTTPPIQFFETLDANVCARLLNVDESSIVLPPQFVSAGSPLLFIALDSPDTVDRAELQTAFLKQALGSVNSVGTFVFAKKQRDDGASFDVYSRMFAPQTGIPEDPATGGATGPLAAYMHRSGWLPSRDGVRFTSHQGIKMGRPSLLHVAIDAARAERTKIRVGGSSVVIARGSLSLD